MKIFIPIAAYLLLMPSITVACSCANFSLFTKWGMAKNVFLAQITHIEIITPGDRYAGFGGMTRGFFLVKEVFKGSADDIPYFTASEFPSALCGTNVEQGASYYVFAENDGPVKYNMCSLTTQEKFYPYYGEVLRKLKNKEPVKTFVGVYDTNEDTLLIDGKDKSADVLELNLYDNDLYRVRFKGYSLDGGRVLATEIISDEVLQLHIKQRSD